MGIRLLEIKQGSQSFYIGDEKNSEAEVHFVRVGETRIILDHTHVAEHLRGKNVGNYVTSLFYVEQTRFGGLGFSIVVTVLV